MSSHDFLCPISKGVNRTLICVQVSEYYSSIFRPTLRLDPSTVLLASPDVVFDEIWYDPTHVSRVIFDRNDLDHDELYHAALNHEHIKYLVCAQNLMTSISMKQIVSQHNIEFISPDEIISTWIYCSDH